MIGVVAFMKLDCNFLFRSNELQVNRNKTDNKLENLEHMTQSENIKHGFATGPYKKVNGQEKN